MRLWTLVMMQPMPISRLGPGEQRQKALNDGDEDSKTVEQHLREVQAFVEKLAKEFGMEEEYYEVYKKHPKASKDIADKQDGFLKEFGKIGRRNIPPHQTGNGYRSCPRAF